VALGRNRGILHLFLFHGPYTHRNPLCLGVGFDEVGGPAEGQEQLTLHHRLNMELDPQSLFGLHVHRCTDWLRPATPLLPRIWAHLPRALLVSQDRRYLLVTLCRTHHTNFSGSSQQCDIRVIYTQNYRKFGQSKKCENLEICIPKIRNKYSHKGIVRPQSHCPHSWFIYSQCSHVRSAFSAAGKYVDRSQTHECGKWD
jgi:hypothetical protein